MRINCPEKILKAIALLESNGYSAYAVGGCVRDSVMGRAPNDWDMTTSAAPDETREVFKDFRTVATGIKHGTVTVLIDSEPVEITTMRVDGKYSDNRHPESVSFTKKIEDDLSRRDFTVNAMAYNPKTGVVDPFGGQNDIKNKIIRCVGNPDTRFGEDALRILRAIRFSSVLGFDIDKKTSQSIIELNNALRAATFEEQAEVEKILADYKSVIFEIIPELAAEDVFLQHTPYHIYDVWTHTAKVVSSIEPVSDLRVAALLHDIEKPSMFRTDSHNIGHFKGHPQKGAETADIILRRLRFSNAEIKHITTIILLHDERPDGNRFHLAKLCSQYGIENVEDTLKLILADAHGKNPAFFNKEVDAVLVAQKQIEFMRKNRVCLKTSELNINGNDIMALGIGRARIKATLDFLLDEVINERIENEISALSRAAAEFNEKTPIFDTFG